MAYARFHEGNSDVYVYRTDDTMICHCSRRGFIGDTARMIEHLQGHVAEGLTVPVRAFERLHADLRAEERGEPRPQPHWVAELEAYVDTLGT